MSELNEWLEKEVFAAPKRGSKPRYEIRIDYLDTRRDPWFLWFVNEQDAIKHGNDLCFKALKDHLPIRSIEVAYMETRRVVASAKMPANHLAIAE